MRETQHNRGKMNITKQTSSERNAYKVLHILAFSAYTQRKGTKIN